MATDRELRERHLRAVATFAFGSAAVEAAELEWHGAEPALVIDEDGTRSELCVGIDGRLWARIVRGQTVGFGVVQDGAIRPLAEGPVGDASAN